MHRLQLETLADNVSMRRAAEPAGFRHEGTLRRTAWVMGEHLDEVVYGVLADEWKRLIPSAPRAGRSSRPGSSPPRRPPR